MRRFSFLAMAAVLATCAAAGAAEKKRSPYEQIQDDPKLPRVLLIGDSISIGYTLPVRDLMEGKANVHRPPTNCASTRRGLAQLDKWLGDGHWDVIHFNWGLHDLKYVKPGTERLVAVNTPGADRQVPPEEYERNLRRLVERLEKTGAKLIWRNTTPVPQGAAGRVVGDAAKYNAIAARIMKEHHIPTNDLHGFVAPRQDKLMRKANVHFTKQGYQKLAEQVVASIEAALK